MWLFLGGGLGNWGTYKVVEDEVIEAPCVSLEGCEGSRSPFKGYSALDAAHVDGDSVGSDPSA